MADEAAAPAAADKPAFATTMQEAMQQLAARRQQTAQPATPAEPTAEAVDEPETGTREDPAKAEGVDGAEDEAEQAGDEHADESEAADDAGDDDPMVEMADGSQLALSELVNGYLRQSAFTKKTQALAEERRTLETRTKELEDKAKEFEGTHGARLAEVEQAKVQASQERDRYAGIVEMLSAKLGEDDSAWGKVDWDRLQREDPVEASRQWVAFQRHKEAKAALKAEQDDIRAKREAEVAGQTKVARDRLAAHVRTTHPELLDPEKGQKLWDEMVETGKRRGFSEAEIKSTLDPRAFDLWMDATLYHRTKRETSKVLQPGEKPKADKDGVVRLIRPQASRPRPATVERAALGGTTAAFNAAPTRENGLKLLRAQRALNAARR